jgi:phenylpropionate dioxygenase-like ring-hydroxylating dioxygenase large terminal subunit
MNNKKLLTDITKTLIGYIKQNTTAQCEHTASHPCDFYTDPARFENEKSQWKKLPQLVGFSQDLPKSGSYFTLTEWPVPLLLTRDHQGEARAFINACSHRNGQLKSGRGQCQVLSCPYHAWAFDLKGNLIKVFEEHTYGEIDKTQFPLTQVQCEEFNGMIYIMLDDTTPLNVAQHLGSMVEQLSRWQLDQLTPVARKVMPTRCNWKLAIETFSEGYHFEPLHKETVGDYAIGNCSHYDRFGDDLQHHRIAFPNKWIKALIGQPEQQWGEENELFKNFQLVHFIYPNIVLLISPVEVEFFQIIPGNDVSEHTTIYTCYVRSPELLLTDEQKDAAKAHFEFIAKVIIDEDYAMVSTIQTTLDATSSRRHSNFGRNEPALHNLHRVLAFEQH